MAKVSPGQPLSAVLTLEYLDKLNNGSKYDN